MSFKHLSIWISIDTIFSLLIKADSIVVFERELNILLWNKIVQGFQGRQIIENLAGYIVTLQNTG